MIAATVAQTVVGSRHQELRLAGGCRCLLDTVAARLSFDWRVPMRRRWPKEDKMGCTLRLRAAKVTF